MKKNVFLKALAGMATIAVLGVSTLVGVSAADTAELSISDATGKAGEEVTLTVDITNNPGVRAFTGRFTFNEELTLVSGTDGMLKTTTVSDGNVFAVAGAKADVTDEDGTLFLLTFEIPEDAEVGDTFDVKWDALLEYFDGEEDIASTFIQDETLINGVITVIDDSDDDSGNGGTTPPAPPATTTPATEDEAPKTGASTKGIAATSAVLLAAACSAVALKKKRD